MATDQAVTQRRYAVHGVVDAISTVGGYDMSEPLPLPVHPLHNPLTTDDEAVLDNVLAVHRVVSDVIERAHRCGMDVSQQQGRNAVHHQSATAFKAHFFPVGHRPLESTE